MEDFFQGVSKAILEYWILICTVLGTSGMALMRTAKQNGKADYLEACLTNNFIILRGEVCKRI